MNVLVNCNQAPWSSGVMNTPDGFLNGGVADYDSDLAFGTNAFSILCLFNCPNAASGYPTTLASYGMPLVNFMQWNSGTAYGVNGWGLYLSGTYWVPMLRYWNAYDNVTAGKYREAGLAGISSPGAGFGLWHCFGFAKTAGLSTVIGAIDGADAALSINNGTSATVGTPLRDDYNASNPTVARVRWFHEMTFYANSNWGGNCFPGAASIWILNIALTAAQLRTLTTNANAIQAAETTYAANLLVRSYSATGDWKALNQPPARSEFV